MALDIKQLSGNMGAGSLAPKVYTYRDEDSTKAEIATADYFLDVYQILDAGDTIYAYGSDGGVNLHVTESTNVTVTVAENSLA